MAWSPARRAEKLDNWDEYEAGKIWVEQDEEEGDDHEGGGGGESRRGAKKRKIGPGAAAAVPTPSRASLRIAARAPAPKTPAVTTPAAKGRAAKAPAATTPKAKPQGQAQTPAKAQGRARQTVATLDGRVLELEAGREDNVTRAEINELKADMAKCKTDALEAAAAAKTQTEANVLAGLLEILADLPGAEELVPQPTTIAAAVQVITDLKVSAAVAACPKGVEFTEMQGKVQQMEADLGTCARPGNPNGFVTTAALETCAKAEDVTALGGRMTVVENDGKQYIKAPTLTAS